MTTKSELSQVKQGSIQQQQRSNILLTKGEIIAGHLQNMALPSIFNKELTIEDYRVWDEAISIYSAAAIDSAFRDYLCVGKVFPRPSDIIPRCIAFAEQIEQESYHKTGREERPTSGMLILYSLMNAVSARVEDFKLRGERYEPMTENEIADLHEEIKRGRFIAPPKLTVKTFPNGNPVYSRELTQARALLSVR